LDRAILEDRFSGRIFVCAICKAKVDKFVVSQAIAVGIEKDRLWQLGKHRNT